MPGPKPPEVDLKEDQREELHKLAQAHKTAQQIAMRAKIIIMLADGKNAPEVARQLGTSRTTVRFWRRQWFRREGLTVVERLQDSERPGAPANFTPEQWCEIMAIACQPPSLSDRPISHWTPRELAEEAIKRGIVESISTRHVGRFLKSGGPKAAPKSVLAQRRT